MSHRPHPKEHTMSTITSRQDLTQAVLDALTDHADEFDIEAIVDELQDRNDNDNQVAANDPDFWEIIEKHAR